MVGESQHQCGAVKNSSALDPTSEMETLPSWGELLGEASDALRAAGVPEYRRAALWINADALGCNVAQLVAYPERAATRGQAGIIRASVRRCAGREPLQYVLGFADFRGLRLCVTPAVLIPRPETEQVVGAALTKLECVRRPRILDIGTGSGCMALTIKHARPDAVVEACDASADALLIARANGADLDLGVTFYQADVFSETIPDRITGKFDLVISNPPYLSPGELGSLQPEVRDHEPVSALIAGDDSLCFYRALGRRLAPALLRPGASLVLETHASRANSVCELLRSAGYIETTLLQDFAGLPRIVCARWPGRLSRSAAVGP